MNIDVSAIIERQKRSRFLVSLIVVLFLLRFIDGIPLGGMLPLAWALNIEYAPKRYRRRS